MLATDGDLDWEPTLGSNVTIMATDRNKSLLSSSRMPPYTLVISTTGQFSTRPPGGPHGQE